MPENFNPYHQWLGLGQQTTSPDPYQLLRLRPGETDAAKITQAADQAQRHLRSLAPGPYAAEWSRLLAEIDAAKNSLLAYATGQRAAASAGGTSASPSGSYRPAPRPRSVPVTPTAQPYPPAAATPAPGGVPMVPMASAGYPQANPAIPRAVPVQPVAAPANLPVAVPASAPVASTPDAAPRTNTAAKARRARKSNNLIMLAGTAGALMLVAAVILLVVVASLRRDDARARDTRVAAVPPATINQPARQTPSPTSPPKRRPATRPDTVRQDHRPAAKSTDSPWDAAAAGQTDADALIQPTEIPPMFGQDAVGNPPSSGISGGPADDPYRDPGASVPPPSMTPPSDAADSSLSPSGLPIMTPVPAPFDPTAPPLPDPASNVPPAGGANPTEQQVQQLSDTLVAARAALENGQFDAALTGLSDVQNLPMRTDHFERYQRLQLLVQYARNFRAELQKAIAALQGGDEIPVGTSTVVGVVQTQADQITVRVAGTNRTYAIDDLPVGLAVAIADLHLAEDDPISWVVKAAHLAARKDARDDQLDKARSWFREAKQKGADIGDLENVLDDKYQLAP